MTYQGKDVFSRRNAGLAMMTALLFALLAGAPAAMAWNGNLVVHKVNVGGPATDAFDFALTKSPNQYQDVWSPATKTFSLTGAPSALGPFTEGTTQKSYNGLWTGNDGTINQWVVYTVKETAKPGYKTTIGCSIAGDWNSQVGTAIPSSYGPWTFTPGVSGADAKVDTTVRWYNNVAYTTTCTFTNTYRARVKVIKRFDDQVSTAPSVDMTVNGVDVDTSTGAETFVDGAASDFISVDGGSDVMLAEQGTATTKLADYTSVLECRKGTDGVYGDWVSAATGTAGTLGSVEPGKDYECRFTNVRKPPPSGGTEAGGPTPGTTPGTTPGPSPVTPSQVPARGTARAVGTSGCAAKYAIVDVRGRQIARVSFRVNGRAAKSFTQPNVSGMFRLRVLTKSLPRGPARVSAVVVFKTASATPLKRLSFQFSRCPARTSAPRPVFTG